MLFRKKNINFIKHLQIITQNANNYSDKNNPIKVNSVPIPANKVRFSCKISTEVTTVITGTI